MQYGYGPPHDAEALPETCPSCASTAIVSAAKAPSPNGYWRCTSCGDIWNPARAVPAARHGWRA